ncbi:hypothetical protein Pla175_21660 [Pirellulimonas nuda]|uniref:DUF1573 domain-containing protein n=1 Tax=Pirellulimonas nuda TaxID=2528009 RepID=A0A518DBE7_9BACT|nr:DUF1573 domain-containing protein [Pirellulimonas nuda]QDU88783.1 hypothetical protein Pla175_21660 [Pirellulimonas nuda]
MRHITAFSAAFCLSLIATVANAQQWALDMVDSTDHDFGAVARGSDTVYKFEITNKYKEDVHIAGVSSSCGCTSPSIENNTIKTWEKAYVVAKFNTRTFTGLHSATLTVRIDQPFPAQIQLRVHGNIRGDVVFEPGSINFGTVDQGATPEVRSRVNFAGRSDWRIEDVKSESGDIEVELVERQRYAGSVNYDLVVRLKESASPGYLKHQLALITNDRNAPRIPLDVEGRVMPAISAAPENLQFGEVAVGETGSKRFLVRGKQPFKIAQIACDDDWFQFSTDENASDKHVVDVRFYAKEESGPVKRSIVVTTDQGETFKAVVTAYATVKPRPAAPSEAPDTTAPEASTASTATKKLAQD